MLNIMDVSSENMDDVFKVCSNANRPDDEFTVKGRAIRTKWLMKMLNEYGSCLKIAYLDEKPVAQLLYYPESVMSFIHDPRNDVIHIQCVYTPFPETQGKGAGAALIRSLIRDAAQGMQILDGRPAQFIVAYPFLSEEGILLSDFYKKMQFNEGVDELFYEINGSYSPRKIPDYTPLPMYKDSIVIFYNPTCEFGYFYANHVKQILKKNFENIPITIYNVWDNYSEYLKRPSKAIIAARVIVNQQTVDDYLFWTDIEGWLEDIREKLSSDIETVS